MRSTTFTKENGNLYFSRIRKKVEDILRLFSDNKANRATDASSAVGGWRWAFGGGGGGGGGSGDVGSGRGIFSGMMLRKGVRDERTETPSYDRYARCL